MIRTLAVSRDGTVIHDAPLSSLSDSEIQWYWADFSEPDENEAGLLDSHFHFHPLAIEDCLHRLQRPKMDPYGDYDFFVFHALRSDTLEREEVDMFLSAHYIVTFHRADLPEMNEAWRQIASDPESAGRGPVYAAYLVMDKLVDQYFPIVYQIEDQINELDSVETDRLTSDRMDRVFDFRARLIKLRRTIVPMRELLYRILSSGHISGLKEQMVYFTDVYDHLLKLSEIIESNRELTSDMRDSFISLNSNRMNTIMKTLTVITTIFMPLTFIAGVYGMNFRYMPELETHYGYFAVLAVMLGIGVGMYFWFRRKGWFD